MALHQKMLNAAEPVVFYEVIPPSAGSEAELASRLELIRDVASQVDAINIPEIREETRNGSRKRQMKERMEPRAFAQAISAAVKVETVVNRVTVHECAADQRDWLRDGFRKYGMRSMILVGGESAEARYPGPSVAEMAGLAAAENLPLLLGGITIPHRIGEAARIREKQACGIRFFTTQVLLDSQDAVRLVRELDGLPVRILLSFTPVSNEKDLDFLEWLGVEIPPAFREQIRKAGSPQEAVEQSLGLARRILAEVYEAARSRGPALGLQVERITKRNSAAARRMLSELSDFYRRLLESRHSVALASRSPA
jgi:5,10-methylenetetrahydrofolate reductase